MMTKIINLQTKLEGCIQQAKLLKDGVPLSEKEQIQVLALKKELKEMEALIAQKLKRNRRLKREGRMA